MKVRINVLKAPWPAGAKVGDVVEMDAITPAFVGKCAQVEDDTAATVEFAKPEGEAKPAKAEAPKAKDKKAEA